MQNAQSSSKGVEETQEYLKRWNGHDGGSDKLFVKDGA